MIAYLFPLVFLLGLVFLSSKTGDDSELLLLIYTGLSRWKLTPQPSDLQII